jgi:hypothetical protein
MRLTQAFSGRPNYYDRAPLQAMQAFDGTVGPHGATTRWTYTVPAGRKANIESLAGMIRRQTVAGTPALFQNSAQYTPFGGSVKIRYNLANNSNAVDGGQNYNIGVAGTMLAGDALAMTTIDGSTTGTVEYVCSAGIFEYDA